MADAKVQEILKQYVLLRMDFTSRDMNSQAGKMIQRFHVDGIPYLRILGPDGAERQEIDARESADLAKELKAALAK